MGIQSRLIVMLLFVALSASGSGSILASAYCAHMANTANSARQAEDHSCCPTGHEGKEAHCNTASDKPLQANLEVHPEHVSDDVAATGELSLLAIPQCGNCLDRSIPIPAYVTLRENNQTRRPTEALPSDPSQLNCAHLMSFKPPVLSRQGAPPGAPTPSHIILSVFLI